MADPNLSLSEKLAEQRADLDIKQGEIGQRLSPPLPQSTVSLYEREPWRLKQRGPEFAMQFFRAYGLTEEEALQLTRSLFAEFAEMLAPTPGDNRPLIVTNGAYVNIYAAGTGPAWGDTEVLDRLFIPGLSEAAGAHIGLKAMGDSMAPYLQRGETAVVLCDDGMVNPGDFCGVWLADDGCVIKRFVRELPHGILLLESLNPGEGEERMFEAPAGSRVLGKVVNRLKDG